MNIENKLKPCPFCGGNVVVSWAIIYNHYAVCCENDRCYAQGPERKTYEGAEKAWNNRKGGT